MNNGFVDLQVNGWRGIDFSSAALTLEDIRKATHDLAERGTLAYCPTMITSSMELYRRNLPLLARAMREPDLAPHLLGIHLEGPFISPEPGARGAHPEAHVRQPSADDLDRLQEWAEGKVTLMTVAPEREGAGALIRHARTQGITVAVGHHLADDRALEVAVDAGATASTHLGNGIPNQIHRHQNPLWFQLGCERLSGMFITDGHHLPPSFIRVGWLAKGREKFIVTSDASPLAGMPAGRYEIFGLVAVVNEAGRIYSEHHQGLVGSHATQFECMNHLASLRFLTADDLWAVGLVNPLRLLGLGADRVEGVAGARVALENGRFVMQNGESLR